MFNRLYGLYQYYIASLMRDTEAIINYRLCATELSAVVYKLASIFNSQIDKDIHSKSFTEFLKSYLTIETGINLKFFLHPMCKDAKSKDNQPSLDFVGDRIEQLCEENPKRDGIGVFPTLLCRGYFGLPIKVPFAQRMHSGLVLVDLRDMHIEVFDSQDWKRCKIYPDKLIKISLGKYKFNYNPALHYHAFGVQKHVVECGLYTLAYIESLLRTGSTKEFEKINIDFTLFKNKWEFLRKLGVDISDNPFDYENVDEIKNNEVDNKESNDLNFEDMFSESPLEFAGQSIPDDLFMPFEIDDDVMIQIEKNDPGSDLLTFSVFADKNSPTKSAMPVMPAPSKNMTG